MFPAPQGLPGSLGIWCDAFPPALPHPPGAGNGTSRGICALEMDQTEQGSFWNIPSLPPVNQCPDFLNILSFLEIPLTHWQKRKHNAGKYPKKFNFFKMNYFCPAMGGYHKSLSVNSFSTLAAKRFPWILSLLPAADQEGRNEAAAEKLLWIGSSQTQGQTGEGFPILKLNV